MEAGALFVAITTVPEGSDGGWTRVCWGENSGQEETTWWRWNSLDLVM